MSAVPPLSPKEERDAFVRLNLTGIIQTVLAAVLIMVFTWFGNKVQTLSENLARTIERQETTLIRLNQLEDHLERESVRVRALELESAKNGGS